MSKQNFYLLSPGPSDCYRASAGLGPAMSAWSRGVTVEVASGLQNVILMWVNFVQAAFAVILCLKHLLVLIKSCCDLAALTPPDRQRNFLAVCN